MTHSGGDSDRGVVFGVNTGGTGFTLLHEFAGGNNDGRWPHGSLILSGFTLYGMTCSGGDSNYGVVFALYDAVPVPTVTTQAVSDITTSTATGNGNITDLGDPNPTAHGVCWNTTGNPTTAGSHTDEGAAGATGAFTSAMTGLSPNTTYYVRAYATNTAGTAYGNEVSFTTNEPASIPTLNEWGMIILSLLLTGTGYIAIRRRKGASV